MTASTSWRRSTLCSKIARDVFVLCSWCLLLEAFPTPGERPTEESACALCGGECGPTAHLQQCYHLLVLIYWGKAWHHRPPATTATMQPCACNKATIAYFNATAHLQRYHYPPSATLLLTCWTHGILILIRQPQISPFLGKGNHKKIMTSSSFPVLM